MSDAVSVSLKTKTGHGLDLSIGEILYEQFHSRTLLRSELLQLKHYNQEDLVMQHISIKQEVTFDEEDKWNRQNIADERFDLRLKYKIEGLELMQ